MHASTAAWGRGRGRWPEELITAEPCPSVSNRTHITCLSIHQVVGSSYSAYGLARRRAAVGPHVVRGTPFGSGGDAVDAGRRLAQLAAQVGVGDADQLADALAQGLARERGDALLGDDVVDEGAVGGDGRT